MIGSRKWCTCRRSDMASSYTETHAGRRRQHKVMDSWRWRNKSLKRVKFEFGKVCTQIRVEGKVAKSFLTDKKIVSETRCDALWHIRLHFDKDSENRIGSIGLKVKRIEWIDPQAKRFSKKQVFPYHKLVAREKQWTQGMLESASWTRAQTFHKRISFQEYFFTHSNVFKCIQNTIDSLFDDWILIIGTLFSIIFHYFRILLCALIILMLILYLNSLDVRRTDTDWHFDVTAMGTNNKEKSFQRMADVGMEWV